MDVLNFVDAVVAFLNIGIFSTLICRFTGANMAMLVFCALLYMGSEPMETVGIMLTYLVFMRLTIYTQKRKLNFKKLQVFKGMRVFVPVLLIVISLFLYPFAALAIFLLLFMVEILAQIKSEIPEDRQLSKGELTKYIVIGSLLTTVSMIAVKFIPAAWYYALGGAVGLFLCGFVWWLGQDRDRLSGIWDTIILLSFIPLGLFGFDMADWMDDMRRSVNPTRIAYNLPFIFLPVFYVGFLMANILFGVFSLSGMCITFFGDRKLSSAIYTAWKKGCTYDSWTEFFHFDVWMDSFRECGIDPDEYAARIRDFYECEPWDHIDSGVTKDYLLKEWRMAEKGILTHDCRHQACNGCGVCPILDVNLLDHKVESKESKRVFTYRQPKAEE
jgi:hypothetical protein